MGTLEIVVALVLITTKVKNLKDIIRDTVTTTCTCTCVVLECTYSLFGEYKLEGWKGIEYSNSDSIPVEGGERQRGRGREGKERGRERE